MINYNKTFRDYLDVRSMNNRACLLNEDERFNTELNKTIEKIIKNDELSFRQIKTTPEYLGTQKERRKKQIVENDSFSCFYRWVPKWYGPNDMR